MIASVELEEVVAEVTLLPVVEVPPVLVPAEELTVTCPSMTPRPPLTTYLRFRLRSHIVHTIALKPLALSHRFPIKSMDSTSVLLSSRRRKPKKNPAPSPGLLPPNPSVPVPCFGPLARRSTNSRYTIHTAS